MSHKVSVIIPTYNRPNRLERALNSVLNQTYDNFEVIVINDGGVDVSDVPFIKSSSVNYIVLDKNYGISKCRNTGLAAATGDYISYLDDDDIYFSNHLERLVARLDNGTNIVYSLAYCSHEELIDGKYVVTKRDIPYTNGFLRDLMFVRNYIPTLCIMHRRDCLEKTGVFDETLETHEDWDLWIRFAINYDFDFCNEPTCEFTSRKDNSSTSHKKRFDFVKSMEKIHRKYYDQVKDKPFIIKRQMSMYEFMLNRANADI